MSEKSEKLKKYVLVAPDGGWGYMICVGLMMINASFAMFFGCFGILYKDFMVEIGMNSTGATLLTGLNALCFSLSGFFASSLTKLMSMRKLLLLAVGIHDVGTFGMVFVKSTPFFILCYGIMMGIGIGTTCNLSYSILNDYFDKKRLFAFSLVHFFVATTSMVAPMLVKWSLQEYGFRGTLLLICGLTVHNIVGVLLLQPAKWHMKKVDIANNTETHTLLIDGATNNDTTTKLTDKAKEIQEKPPAEVVEEELKKSVFMRAVETVIDIAFAKKFLLTCACIGPSLCTFADNTYSLIFPQSLYALGWSQDKVALGVSMYSFGDLVTRAIFILASKWLIKVGSQKIYLASTLLAALTRLGMLWSENEIAIFTYIALMGACRCSFMVLLPMVISEVISPHYFSQAMGISMLLCGLTGLVLGPAIGVIRDLTNSYNTAFYLLTSLFAIVGMFWSIELCYKLNKDKRKLQQENLEKIKSGRLNKGK